MRQLEREKSSILKTDEFLDINSELSFEKDPFEKARFKGSRSWILAHLFYKKNKYLLFFYIILCIILNFMRSFQFVIIGYAIEYITINIGVKIAPNIFYWKLLFFSITMGGWVIIDLGAKILRIVLAHSFIYL